MNKICKKIFLFCLLCIFVLVGLTACGGDEGVKVNSANSLAKKLASDSAIKINVSKDLVLEEPIVVTGEKEIVGNGKIIAAVEDGEELYMITVADGGKLTVGGSVKIDAAGLMGAIHVKDGGSAIVKGKAVVKNASEATANALVEGSFEVKGGTLKGAKGHNIYNKKETVISGGKVTGSGDEFAGIYNEGTLTQNGGTISAAYNNVSNIKGSAFVFEGGSNEDSTRDGVFVAEGATMKATNKDATIINAGARGILLQGKADIKVITVKECGDSLVKVAKTGVLNLGNGILQGGNYHGVENAGTMNMLGGNIQMNANCGIVNTGTLKVTSGNIAENANKGILNKHEGKADVTSAMVTFTSNKTAIANEDKAVFEFAKAKLLMSTQTNIYCYDGTINIHDASLNASTSNNVRIVDGVINMTNVEVKGNSQKSGTSHHGIYMEGGVINAENVTVSMTTGNGIRNKGGVFNGKNIIMHDINRVAISQGKHDYLDVEGLTEIEGLEIQSTNYANIVNDGGGTIKITNGKLAIASSNSVRSNDGVIELTNVNIPGHKEGSKDNIHGIYLEGGKIVAEKVTVQNVSGNALRNKNGTFIGKNIKLIDIKGQSAIWNLPLNDEEKNGIIDIDGLTIKNSASKNLTLDCGVTTIKNATLGPTGGNNIKMQNNAATLNLYNVKIQGQIKDATASTHGIMVEGGNVFGENIEIANTNACGIRCKLGVVDLKNVTMTEIGQAGISNSKMVKNGVQTGVGNVTVEGITITKVGTNNVVVDAGKVTIKNGVLGKVETNNHNTKVSGTGVLVMDTVKVEGTSNGSKYGIIAEGGEAVLTNVQIYDLAKSGIHANKETSKVTGKNVTIENGLYGITGSNGSITINGLTTSGMKANNILADNKLKVTITNGNLGTTPGHNVKITGDALVTLKKSEIQGVTDGSKHGIMAEGGDAVLKNVTISNVKNTAIRINKATSEVTGKNVTIIDCGSGVTGTNGKVVIDGLTTTGVTNNNVVADGQADFTITNGDLCKVTKDAHNTKVGGTAKLTMTDVVIKGTTSGSKYGLIAEGGEAVLKNVTIQDLAKSGIHANRETSKVTGKNVTIQDGEFGITGSNGNITIDDLTIAGISQNNILADSNLKVTATNAVLGETAGHNVKITGDAVVTLEKAEIQGVSDGSKHGVMAEGGDVVLTDVTISNVKNTAIRINEATSEVTGKNVTIIDSGNGVTGTNGKVVINGLTTTGVAGNNVVAEGKANFTIKNADLCKVTADAHNTKVAGNATLNMTDVVIHGTTSGSKYGLIAEGGEAVLKNVEIYDLAKSGIHANQAASKVTGENVTIANGVAGITGSAGTIELKKLKTYDIAENNITISGNCVVIVTKSSGGYGLGVSGGHSVKVIDDAIVDLDTVEVKGVTAGDKHGIMAEGGDVILNNVSIHDVANSAIRINVATSEVTGKNVVIKDSNNAVSGSAGKVVIDGLTTSRISNNNVLCSGSEENNCEITIKNGDLGWTSGHNVKSEAYGKVTLENTEINGVVPGDKYGVMAEGGYVKLNDVTIKAITAAAIRSNRDTSVVEGTNVTITKSDTGVSVGAGTITIDELKSSATTSNVTVSGGTMVITNGTLNRTADSNVTLSGGTLTLNDVDINGTSANHGVLVTGGELTGDSLEIKDTASTALYNSNGGKVTLTDLTVSGTKSANNIYNVGENSSVRVDGGELGKSPSNNVVVASGKVTLKNIDVNGSTNNNTHGIFASGGDVELDTVTIKDAKNSGIRINKENSEVTGKNVTITSCVNAIHMSPNGKVTIDGLTTSNMTNNNIRVGWDSNSTEPEESGEVTINNYADGKKSILGETDGHNVVAYVGIVNLNNVQVNGTSDAGDTKGNSALFAHGGDLNLVNVDVAGAEGGTGIRINRAASKVTGSNVTINGCNMGISYNGNIDITGLTCNATTTNVEIAGGTFNIKDATFGKTAASNILVKGGTATLENATINGTSGTKAAYGIEVAAGTLNLKGDVTVQDTSLEAIYNYGGTINGAESKTVTIKNTGSTAIWTTSGASTTLKGVTISGVAAGHSVKAENADTTVVIDGGEFGQTIANNVYSANGTITLKNVTVNGTTAGSIHGLMAAGGDFVLENVTVKNAGTAGIRVNNANSVVTGTNVTLQNSVYGIWTNASEVTIDGLTTSGITGNNILAETAAKVTVNAYADNTNSVLGIAGGHNVKANPDALVTLNDVAIQGTSSTGHRGVMAEGGDFVLNNVEISGVPNKAGIYLNNGKSTVTGNNVIIKDSLNGIRATAGEVTINGLTTSGILNNNILAESSAKITVNAYADGTKSVLGIAGGHNVKTTADGLIILNDASIQGSSGGKHGVMAEGGDFVLNNVEISGTPNGAGIRANNKASEVTGTNITISDVKEGISNTSATFALENVTIGTVTGAYEFYNAGSVKLAGAIDANIYNDIATTIEVTKALTGDIELDWKDGKEPAVAIQFASAADADASKPYIKLGEIQAAKYELLYVDDTALLAAPILVPSTEAATLQDAVNAIAATGEPGFIRVSENLTIDTTVTIPAGSDVTIVNTNGAKTIARAATLTDKHMIEVASGATLTITSTGDNTTPAMYIDGGSKSEPQVITKGYTSLIHSSGTLNVDAGVEITNVKGATSYGRGYGILADSKGTTTVKGKITSMEGQASDRGIATVVSGGATVIFEDAIIENNKSNGISAIYVEGGSQVIARNTIFKNNSTDIDGGAISLSGNASNKLTVEKCHFESNNTNGRGGAILNECPTAGNIKITDSTFVGNTAKNGGAIYNKGKMTITGTDAVKAIFKENTASNWGGAIYTDGGALSVEGYTFDTNKGVYGGAILMYSESTISNCTFQSNQATGNEGGAIYVNKKSTFTDCKFDGNIAKTNGGAICFSGNVEYELIGTDTSKAIFTSNESTGNKGGAIYLHAGTLKGNGYTFTSNTPEDVFVRKGKATNSLQGQYVVTEK